jgi:hypothetical protein
MKLLRRAAAFNYDAVCIGGQGTEPYEQKTQQSPNFGRSSVPHPVH